MQPIKGFSLIELVIVVLILGILMAFAFPRYQLHVVKGNRVDMQASMVEISQKIQAYQIANRSYQGLTLSDTRIYGSSQFPKEDPLYDVQLDLVDANNDTVMDGWTLIATPIASELQKKDGQIRLNDQGWRCWTKGAATCTLSATSSWKSN